MAATSLAKAEIVDLETGGAPVKCMFNPKEYTFSKRNQWKIKQTSGTNVPKLEFAGGDPATLQLQLFFDTYAEGKDVRREYTDAIWALMLVSDALKDKKNKMGRPPKVKFQWGTTWSFVAVISGINQKFTLFLPNGTPVRATLDVTFQQIGDAKLFPGQNPTLGGTGGERAWTVREGDTLAWIAYRELGDPNEWRRIAEANGLTSVRDLAAGQVLQIPL